jgi:threonine dehydrogenase-like Zn-dependent dehydrogenase
MIGVQRPGGFAEYVKVPEENLIPIPEGLDLKRAALVEPMAVAVHGFKLASPFLGESALIIGAGPIGLMLAMVADHGGCAPIFLTERSPNRIRMAKEFGFNCIDIQNEDYETIINEQTGGKGVDMIFECVGHPSTMVQIPTVGAMRSRAVIVGAFHEPQVEMDLFAMSKKEQTIHLSWQYDIDDFRTALDVLLHSRFPVDSLISHILPLKQIPEALELMRSGVAVKVLIDPNSTLTSVPSGGVI